MEFETSFSGSGTSEDVQSEPSIYLPFVPGYFSPVSPTKTLAHYEDTYSILLEHPPPKAVSVGPNHQADIPVWDSNATSNSRPNASDAVGDNKVEERFMGTCLIPMPQMELSIYKNEEVGKDRTDCICEDKGSMRCVKPHIMEAREELIKNIGHETFADLGLSDMGEQVADKWSAEEEQLFCEVVFNSPTTLGKTFWSYLSIAFPLRISKEIVSYYFNVFMLRRRAEQNRNGLLNVDSDDDNGNIGIATLEEDEDYVTESPVYQDDNACLANCHENDLQDIDEYASDETCAVNEAVDFKERNIDDDQTVWQERFEFDEEVQDDSCTSCEAGVTSQETQVNTEYDCDHWCGNHNKEHNGCYSQGYVLEPW